MLKSEQSYLRSRNLERHPLLVAFPNLVRGDLPIDQSKKLCILLRHILD